MWAPSSVFPCQISHAPPCLFSLLMEGWTWRGDWERKANRCGRIDRMAKRLFPPDPSYLQAKYRLPQHSRTYIFFQLESNGVRWWGRSGAFYQLIKIINNISESYACNRRIITSRRIFEFPPAPFSGSAGISGVSVAVSQTGLTNPIRRWAPTP